MFEHKLHYNFEDQILINTGKSPSIGFSDVKILLPRNELCWDDEFKGKLRLVDTKTFKGPQPVSPPSFRDPKIKFSLCQVCKIKLPFNPTLKRCKRCKCKYYAKLRKEKRIEKNEKK